MCQTISLFWKSSVCSERSGPALAIFFGSASIDTVSEAALELRGCRGAGEIPQGSARRGTTPVMLPRVSRMWSSDRRALEATARGSPVEWTVACR